jgi:hypothetical protein
LLVSFTSNGGKETPLLYKSNLPTTEKPGTLEFEASRNSKIFYYCPNNFLIRFGDGLNGIEPNWQFTGPSLILGSTLIINTELFKFFENQFPNTTLGKTDVVRPRNRFGKPNPGVSTPTKCFWIPTGKLRASKADY